MLILAVAAGLWVTYRPEARSYFGLAPAPAPEARPAPSAPPQVIAAPVEAGPMIDRLHAVGTARGTASVQVASEVEGRIARIHAAPGTRIEKGALIAELQSETAAIAVERAALAVGDARRALDRLERLEGSGTVTSSERQDASSARASAELALRAAELDLNRHRITAPVAGWVGLMAAEEGDYVAAGDEMTTLEDRSELIVDFRLPERLAPKVTAGMVFEARALADPSVTLEARLSAIDNRVDPESRTIRVEARLVNRDDRLRPGMAIELTGDIAGETHPSVDPLSIQWGAEGAFVWILRQGLAERLPVRILQRRSDAVLVDGAFATDDLVVVEGMLGLRPGEAAEVVPGGPGNGPGNG